MRNILVVGVLFLAVFACGSAFGQGPAPRPEGAAGSEQTVVRPKKGSIGTYQGRRVEVTEVNADGTLNLIGTDPVKGSEGTFRKENVPANQFTADDAVPAQAAGAAPKPVESSPYSMETITVTASKRVAPLEEVPISVSVTDAKTIERAVVRDLIDLQTIVPSLQIQQFNAVGQTNFIIRGFGNGSGNDGIESSVGVFVDGVYRSRLSSAIGDLFGLERIEVLRGPQSTLFGKNVSAGSISIVTEKPQFTSHATGEISLGNYNGYLVRASVTGPVSDNLAFGVSATGQVRDGYQTNTTTGNDVNDRHRGSVRADMLWEPSAQVSARVIGDYNQIRETCCGVVSIFNGPATQFIGAAPPFGLGRPVGNPAKKFENKIIFNTDPTNRLSDGGISAQFDLWRRDVAALTSITALRNQKNASTQDVDFTGADLANKNQSNNISMVSQELRLASDGKGPLTWLVGGFFMKEKIKSTGTDVTYGTDIRAYADGLSGRVPAALLNALPAALRAALTGRSNIYALEFLQSLVTPSIIPGSTYFQAGQGISDFYSMDDTAYSTFGNVSYKFAKKLTITGGLGYLGDRKEARSNVVLTDKFALLNLQKVPQFAALGLPPGLYGALGGLQFFYANTPNHAPVNFPNANESGKLSGHKLTKSLNVTYNLGRANMYASYNTGWKAGAVNLSSDSRPPDVNGIGRTADPEDVTAYELGAKSVFQGGFFNLALFKQSIDGFQSNLYTGTAYALGNAGKTTIRGVEMDLAYSPVTWLALTGAATYLDPKYNSFVRAPCFSFDTVRCPINPATGLIPNFRDLSGQRPAGIPKWVVSPSASLSHQFSRVSGYLRGDYYYVSSVHLTESTPPDISTYGKNTFNASMGLVFPGPHQYEVMLWGRNLTNNKSIAATFPTVAQTGSYSGFPTQPVTYGVAFLTKF